MKSLKICLICILFPILLWSQQSEVEPNDSNEQANSLSLAGVSSISAVFNPAGDVDYFVMEWQKDCMYYLTSIENDAGVAPNIELYFENNPTNILTSNVGGRNGNNNFRLSGYVPAYSGRYYAKIYNDNGATGAYKIRLAGGHCREQLLIHEPDNTISFAASFDYLAENDTSYGALYPSNDIDYFKIFATAGRRYTISTLPILDLAVRDTDTYITLYDSLGRMINENDDVGTVETTDGPVNCTFSRMIGVFPHSGTYYISVRSYYNTRYDQTISETNPPMGEYGLYFITDTLEATGAFARYPHIEIPTTSSVLVQWHTMKPQPTYLQWGESEACDQVIQDPELKLDHIVKIAGLKPHSKYYYRIPVSVDDSTHCEHFYTAKPITKKDVKFFVISDTSPYSGFGSTPEQLQIADQILKVDYDFGLHAGDVNQHHGEEYDLVFFQPYKDILKNATIFPCIGNHDTNFDGAQTYLKSFNLPHNNPDSTERYYSFNYGHAHFICLDTNIPYYPGSLQYEWLKQDLESKMRRQTMWTFVYFHHPPWSEGWPDYPGEIDVRNYLVPLFEKYHVDMVFNGHTHDYERGFLNGVYYIITGGGGCTLEAGIQAYDWEHVAVWINQHQFTYIQLHDKSLELQSINKDGLRIDLLSFDKHVIAIDQEFQQMREVIPDEFRLHQNFPNPFNQITQIKFDIKERTILELTVFDVNGREVRHLVLGRANPGYHHVEWDGTNDAGEVVASGIYLIRLTTPNFQQMQRAVYLK